MKFDYLIVGAGLFGAVLPMKQLRQEEVSCNRQKKPYCRKYLLRKDRRY